MLEVPPPSDGQFGLDGPYDGYSGQYALKRVALMALSKEEQGKQLAAQSDSDLALEAFTDQKHQVGGYPVIANPQSVVCPACSKEAPFLALICDDASGNKPGEVPTENAFTDNPGVQVIFHFCRDCSVVSAYHSAD